MVSLPFLDVESSRTFNIQLPSMWRLLILSFFKSSCSIARSKYVYVCVCVYIYMKDTQLQSESDV